MNTTYEQKLHFPVLTNKLVQYIVSGISGPLHLPIKKICDVPCQVYLESLKDDTLVQIKLFIIEDCEEGYEFYVDNSFISTNKYQKSTDQEKRDWVDKQIYSYFCDIKNLRKDVYNSKFALQCIDDIVDEVSAFFAETKTIQLNCGECVSCKKKTRNRIPCDCDMYICHFCRVQTGVPVCPPGCR